MSEQVLQTPAKRKMRFPTGAVLLLIYVVLSVIVSVVSSVLIRFALGDGYWNGGIESNIVSLIGHLISGTAGVVCVVLAILMLAKKHGPVLSIPCFGLAATAMGSYLQQSVIVMSYGFGGDALLESDAIVGWYFGALYGSLAEIFLAFVWTVLAIFVLVSHHAITRRVFKVISNVAVVSLLPLYAGMSISASLSGELFQRMMSQEFVGAQDVFTVLAVAFLPLITMILYVIAVIKVKSWIANPYLDGEPVAEVVENGTAEPVAPVTD